MPELDLLSILSKDTIDMDAVNETLRKSSIVNFQTLYDISQSLVKIQRYDIPFSEFKQLKRIGAESSSKEYPRRYVTYLSHDMIKYDKHQAFRESGYYNMSIDQETISKLPDIFRSNYFVFADGKFLNTTEVVCTEGEVTLVVDVMVEAPNTSNPDGIPYELYRHFVDNNTTITVLFVPNYKYAKASFNLPTLTKEKGILKSTRFTGFDTMDETTLFFINKDMDQSMSSMLPECILGDSAVTIQNYQEMTQVKMSLHGITIPFLKEVKRVGADNNWFMTSDEYNLPLAAPNILAMDVTTHDFLKDVTINHYYPNMYEVEGIEPGHEVDLLIFYKDTNDEKYTNDLALLNHISSDLVDMYKDGKIPDRVRDYQPLDIRWFDTEGFKTSIYFPNKVTFSIASLDDYIKKDPNIWLRYLYAKLRDTPKYYINMAKLSLEERLREDTLSDTDQFDESESLYFDEPHYIFSMRKKFVGGGVTEFRLFLDNVLLTEEDYVKTTTNDFYNFYIPTRLVTETSMLEIEKIKEYTFVEELGLCEDTNKVYDIIIPSTIDKIHVNNIELLITDKSKYLNYNQYKIMAYSDILETYIPIVHNGHAIIRGHFKIQITDENIIGHNITVMVNHGGSIKTFVVKEDGENTFNVLNTSNMTSTNTRVFLNGLQLPIHTYRVLDKGYYGRYVRVMTGITLKAGDKFTVDVMAHDYTCEYTKASLGNEYAFVDTGNQLSLPFDLKWYDAYLNGRKLNKNNVDIVTTTKFFIKGIDSLRNLYIFLRDTAATEFYGDHTDSIKNYIYDNMEEIRDAFIKDREIVEDTLEDILEDFVSGGIMDFYAFVDSVLQYIFINPNIQQLDASIEAEFPTMFDDHKICWLDCNTYPDAEAMEFINSNVRSEEMKQNQYRYGFTPLHIGAHDDAKNGEYMCDPVTGAPGMRLPDGTVIASGSLDRLATHKDRFGDSLLYGNMGYASIYNVEPLSGIETAKEVTLGADIAEEPIQLGKVSKFRVSLDIAVLKAGNMGVLGAHDYNPTIKITYTIDGEEHTASFGLGELAENDIVTNMAETEIKTITVEKESETDDVTGIKMILYSILVAF